MKTFQKFIATWMVSVIASASMALAAVNLNTASEAELESLPGVGAKVAQDIMKSRPYKSVDDLKSVKGMGDKKFSKIAPMVTVENNTDMAAHAPSNMPMKNSGNGANSPQANSKSQSGAPSHSGKKEQLAAGEKININTASKEDLERLPGIGDKKAEAIMGARPFKTPEDLMKVKGIKQGIFSKIQSHITTG